MHLPPASQPQRQGDLAAPVSTGGDNGTAAGLPPHPGHPVNKGSRVAHEAGKRIFRRPGRLLLPRLTSLVQVIDRRALSRADTLHPGLIPEARPVPAPAVKRGALQEVRPRMPDEILMLVRGDLMGLPARPRKNHVDLNVMRLKIDHAPMMPYRRRPAILASETAA